MGHLSTRFLVVHLSYKTVPAIIHIFMPLLLAARVTPWYVFRALYHDQSSLPGTSWVRDIQPWNLLFHHPNCSNVPQGQSILHQKCSKYLLLSVDTHLVHSLPLDNNSSHAHSLYPPVSSSHTARITWAILCDCPAHRLVCHAVWLSWENSRSLHWQKTLRGLAMLPLPAPPCLTAQWNTCFCNFPSSSLWTFA